MKYEKGDKVEYVYSLGDYKHCECCGSEIWVENKDIRTGVITSYNDTRGYYSARDFSVEDDVIVNPDGSKTLKPRIQVLQPSELKRFYKIDGKGSFTDSDILKIV